MMSFSVQIEARLSLKHTRLSLYFCAVYDYAGKAYLSKGYAGNSKRKLEVATDF